MLRDGWYEQEGAFGNQYRWMGAQATAVLRPTSAGGQRLRVRGFAHQLQFQQGQPVRIELTANGRAVARQVLDRPGLFIIEAGLAPAEEYFIEIASTPAWTIPNEDRTFTVNIGMIRLMPADSTPTD